MTQQINLIDPSLIPRRDYLNGQVMLMGLALLLLGVGGHAAYEKALLAKTMAASMQAAAPAQAADASVTPPQQAEEERVSRAESLLKALGNLGHLPKGNAARLERLFAALPPGAWLREVEFNPDDGLRIVGGTLDVAQLAHFATQLNGADGFRGLPLHLYAMEPAPIADGDTRATTRPWLNFQLSTTELRDKEAAR
jgi:hypothetical protein